MEVSPAMEWLVAVTCVAVVVSGLIALLFDR